MNRLERFNDTYEMLLAALTGAQAKLWTAMPGIIQSFDPAKMTCSVQPAIQAVQTLRDGSERPLTMTQILDVPVVFGGGGGFVATFPVAAGDECLVVFASRCIDNWWLLGGVRSQAELRMHSLSDGFALVGPFSQPKVIPGVSVNSAQIRSRDGLTYVEVGPGSAVRVEADAVKAHARASWSWDVNGYGQRVSYLGANTWHVDNYQTARPGDTVVVTNHNVSPPEAP